MPLHPSVKICTHIKVTGIRCGSPALGGEKFCYFHQRMIRGVRTPPKARIHPMALIENEEGIQVALMETINAIVRNTIDLKRASLILRALSIAARNARHVHFNCRETEMVRAIPEYPPAPSAAAPPKEANPAPSTEDQTRTARTQTWDQQWDQQKEGTAQTQVPRKPPGRVTSAPAAEAQAMNARPLRE